MQITKRLRYVPACLYCIAACQNVGMVMVVHFQGQCLLWLLSKCIWMKGGFLQSRRWIAAYLINLNDSPFALTITSKELQNNVCVVKEDNLEKYPQTREPGLCPLGMHVIYRNQRNLSVNKFISSRHVWPMTMGSFACPDESYMTKFNFVSNFENYYALIQWN